VRTAAEFTVALGGFGAIGGALARRLDRGLPALQRRRDYLTFFRDKLHGRFVTPDTLKPELEQLAAEVGRMSEIRAREAAALSPRASRARSGPAPSQ
jgi:hypothetical protein